MICIFMFLYGMMYVVKTIQLNEKTNPLDGAFLSEKNNLLNKPFKVLDWEQMVDLCIEYDILNAFVGLAEDWIATCAMAIEYGVPYDYGINIPYGYCLASRWATPCLYDDDNTIAYECYYETYNFNWDKHAKGWWPNDTKERYIYERK